MSLTTSSRKLFVLNSEEDLQMYELRQEFMNRVQQGYYKTKKAFLRELTQAEESMKACICYKKMEYQKCEL